MSRVGKKPIFIPEGVDVSIDGQSVCVKGAKGTLTCNVIESVSVSVQNNENGKKVLTTSIVDEGSVEERSQWGTARSILANMVHGVSEGFSKTLEINGVGYRVALSGQTVVLNVGYSHPIEFTLPEGIDAAVEGNKLTISGFDKQLVGEMSAQIRKVRKPEPYKGKGIKYSDEVIRRKAGKSAKAGE